jgi:alkanesulfonate monooxygenase SsuD/methylene tetrahydromethanopterin reductase-like flavin-dependent oxidoreductase (luciferase family)
VKFGLWLCSQYALDDSLPDRFEDLVAQVRLAGQAGFDSIWTGQHYLMPTYQQFQPVPLLARLAGEAGAMSIGTSLTLVPLHHPVELAETVATLDIVCRGRFIWGVGLGYRDQEFEAFGVPKRERAARFEESIALIRRLWAGERVTHEGPFYALRDAVMHLRPVQRPHPPLLVGASTVAAARRAAQLGDGILLNIGATLDSMMEQMAAYRAGLQAIARPTPPICALARDVYIAATDDEAWTVGGPMLEARYHSYGRWGMDRDMPAIDRLDLPLADLARGRFVLGSPESCRQQLQRYVEELGVDYLVLRVQTPDVPQKTALHAIEWLGGHVLPELRNADAARSKHATAGERN